MDFISHPSYRIGWSGKEAIPESEPQISQNKFLPHPFDSEPANHSAVQIRFEPNKKCIKTNLAVPNLAASPPPGNDIASNSHKTIVTMRGGGLGLRKRQLWSWEKRRIQSNRANMGS